MWADRIPFLALKGTTKPIDSVGLPCSTLPNSHFLTMCMDTLHAQLKLPVSPSFCPEAFHLSQYSVYWQCSSFYYYYLLRARPICISSNTVDEHPFSTGAVQLHPCAAATTVSKACQRTRIGKGSSVKLFFIQLCNQVHRHNSGSSAGLQANIREQESKQPSCQIPTWQSSCHHSCAMWGRASPPKAPMSPIHRRESTEDWVRENLSSCLELKQEGMTKGSYRGARCIQDQSRNQEFRGL